MANTYTNEVTASQSTTEQSWIIRCDVSQALHAGDVITVETTNSVPLELLMAAFANVASGAAANTHTGVSPSSLSPSSGALTAATAGDLRPRHHLYRQREPDDLRAERRTGQHDGTRPCQAERPVAHIVFAVSR